MGSSDLTSIAQDLSIGDPHKDEARLKQTSPVYRAGDIKIPVLAAWGATTSACRWNKGGAFATPPPKPASRSNMSNIAGEGHNWLKPETSIDFFGRVEKLLAKTIGDEVSMNRFMPKRWIYIVAVSLIAICGGFVAEIGSPSQALRLRCYWRC